MLVCELLSYKRPLSADIRSKHLQYLRDKGEKGMIALSGKFGDDKGGLIVWKVPTLDVAKQLASDDPFLKEDWATYELREWVISLNYIEKVL